MKQFIETKLFLLAKEFSQNNHSPSTWENAYDEFAHFLLSEGIETPDKLHFHQTLCYTHAELTSLRSSWMREVEKKRIHYPVFG
ncbi:hypothetical protein AGMMS49525_03420 [Bacteroidia bacterium]|nr:hypothetical protein AGMMS49525_03420 [Bacteroidia bacterium]